MLFETRSDAELTHVRALTVCQPWAWAIVDGHKLVENRTRLTKYRGPLVIHAGKSMAWDEHGRQFLAKMGLRVPERLPLGAIVGVVDLVDCVRVEDLARSAWASGPFCWVLSNPRKVAPMAWSGQLGLWQVPRSVVGL